MARASKKKARADLVADGARWKRVEAPKPWRPVAAGEALVGEFFGKQQKTGQFGPYEVIIVRTADGPVFAISGSVLMSLVDGAALQLGQMIRVVFGGKKPFQAAVPVIDPITDELWNYREEETRQYKDFELFVLAGGK